MHPRAKRTGKLILMTGGVVLILIGVFPRRGGYVPNHAIFPMLLLSLYLFILSVLFGWSWFAFPLDT